MGYRLKSRVHQVPHGFRFVQPELKWDSVQALGRHPSWEKLVNAVMALRLANPAQTEKHKWRTDVLGVADDIDAYIAADMVAKGHVRYVTQGEGAARSTPKSHAPSGQERKQLAAVAGRVEKIWGGIRTLNDWDESGDPAVPSELSEARAKVCSQCPKNGQGDFTHWFTKPAALAIQMKMERAAKRELRTTYDPMINVCEVCLCPLKLKVHTPMTYIARYLSPSVQEDLRQVKGCWVTEELAKAVK